MRRDLPAELVPEPVMTLTRFKEYVQICLHHPLLIAEPSCDLWKTVKPGDTVSVHFKDWNKSYTIKIVEDYDWDEFEDLRVEWDEPVPVAN